MSQKQTFLEILSAAFSAGEIKTYAFTGGYFELIDCPYPVTVTLIGLDGAIKGVMRNAEASFYLTRGDYQTITIESPQAQTLRFAYGSSEAGTRRTAGVVQVVDGGKARTLASNTYLASAASGAAAGLYSHCQIWNPIGSGKNIVIQQVIMGIVVSGGGAAAATLRPTAAPIATLQASPQSKLINAATGVAQARAEQSAAPLGAAQLAGFSIQSLVPFVYRMTEPVVLRPGSGLLMAVLQVNTSAELNAELYEEQV